MLRRLALVRTDVWEELNAIIIRMTRKLIFFLSHFEFLRSVRRFIITADVVPSSSILVTRMMESQSSSETSAFTRTTRSNIPDDGILLSHRRENLKPYVK
jgi:sulfur relay (sulfurtransferase) DsrC/TusE family protein